MATYNEQMQSLFDRYQREVDAEPTILDDVYAWATKHGLWEGREESMRAQFKEEMAEALREEYRTDKSGRRYRAKQPARKVRDGKQMSFWGDIDTSPRAFLERAFAQKRRHIAGQCHQLKVDVDHVNDARFADKPIALSLNFEDDVNERLMGEGLAEAA